MRAALREWVSLGVTAWLPTIVTNGNGAIDRALTTLAAGTPDGL